MINYDKATSLTQTQTKQSEQNTAHQHTILFKATSLPNLFIVTPMCLKQHNFNQTILFRATEQNVCINSVVRITFCIIACHDITLVHHTTDNIYSC